MRRMLCPSVVGRDDELASLSAGLDDLQDGRGGCFLLAGEPGIGKSRLAREAAAAAQRRGLTVLFGRASPTGASEQDRHPAALGRGGCFPRKARLADPRLAGQQQAAAPTVL